MSLPALAAPAVVSPAEAAPLVGARPNLRRPGPRPVSWVPTGVPCAGFEVSMRLPEPPAR